uniref:PiggyBac transposable element-derived protein domain-containing protein n=1 Tax=Cuerna arida TaxID=1464854 RepID=A0A1B6GX11_9HEMI
MGESKLFKQVKVSRKTDMCKRSDRKEKKFVEIPCPGAIQLYNQSMWGVDKLDFLITIYRTFIRSKKWTLRMIYHSIDLAVTNSLLECVKDATVLGVPKSQRLDLIHFRQHVFEALIRCNTVRGKKRGRPVKK